MDVRCDNLVVSRGDFTLRADIAVPAGNSLALIGPSGAGKSLFLNALAGFEAVAGRIRMGGVDVTGADPGQRPVSMMFQSHNLFPHLTVFDNVALGRSPGLRLSEADRSAVMDALGAVDLGKLARRYPADLSGGQESRVALARVLVRRKPVLLLDEPFSALGPAMRRDVGTIVRRFQAAEAMTLIMVTHDPDEARAADLAAFVEAGHVHPARPPATLFADPPPGLAAYL